MRTFVGAVINIVLGLLLIPHFGPRGAAVATLVAMALSSMIVLLFAGTMGCEILGHQLRSLALMLCGRAKSQNDCLIRGGKMRTPIALFVYRRPVHLASVLTALTLNPEAKDSLLYVFSDAPKDERAAGDVRQVRDIVQNIRGFGEARVIHRDRNFGLSRSIIDGVSHVLSKHHEIIVVEDDLVAGPHMLRFFNEGLALYRDEPRVGNITAYCYPVIQPLPETYFLRGADCCWGWATWKDRWKHFNADGVQLLQQLRTGGLTRAFDLDGEMQYTGMLEDQISGRNDSWAIRWHASCFLLGLLTLYPGRSLVQNIGFDGINSTHCRPTDRFNVDVHMRPIDLNGVTIVESAEVREVYKDFFRRTRPPFFQARKLLRSLRNMIATRRTAAAQ